MDLLSLRLQSFRSYKSLQLTPPKGVTVIVGENGTGKTNLLEAIHLCCLGRSHRTSNDSELIQYNEETAAVQLVVNRKDGKHDVGVRLYRNQKRKKLLYLNGKTAPKIGEMMGHATCVMFAPEDLSIVKDGPACRRRFLDMLLSQINRPYFYALQNYHFALRQRNALLKTMRFDSDPNLLDVWDEQLSQAGAPIIRMRRQTIQRLNELASSHYAFISGRQEETLCIAYQGRISPENEAEKLFRALVETRPEDIRRQATGVGPHRDDLGIDLAGQDLRAFASQGQARTAALSLKLAAYDILTAEQGEPPLLLLDDVLSELDPTRREKLIERIKGAQAFITCTDQSDFLGATPACVLRVHNGIIEEA